MPLKILLIERLIVAKADLLEITHWLENHLKQV